MSDYYDRSGAPITMEKWLELFGDKSYQQVLRWEGEGKVLVSTVWLGLDHRFVSWGEAPAPLIFETMIFGLPHPSEYGEYQHRYTTLGAATEGHWRTVDDVIHGRPIWFEQGELE